MILRGWLSVVAQVGCREIHEGLGLLGLTAIYDKFRRWDVN